MKRDCLGLAIPRVVKMGSSGRRWERFLLQVQRYPGCYRVEVTGCQPMLFYSMGEYYRYKQIEQEVKNRGIAIEAQLAELQKQQLDSSEEVKEDKKDLA